VSSENNTMTKVSVTIKLIIVASIIVGCMSGSHNQYKDVNSLFDEESSACMKLVDFEFYEDDVPEMRYTVRHLKEEMWEDCMLRKGWGPDKNGNWNPRFTTSSD
jgi:hypothetical protein